MNRGPLFRLLRLERHICPSCHRDNIHRSWRRQPGASRLRQCPERCRWCGASMVDYTSLTRAIEKLAALGTTFQQATQAVQRAIESFGEAFNANTYVVDVETATHDDLKEGNTATRYSRVRVLAGDEDEAKLVACQMAATDGRMPTRATVRSPEEVRAEEGARQITQAYRLDNPLGSAVELRKDVP